MDSSGVCVFVAIRYAFSKDRMILPLRVTEMMNLSTGGNTLPKKRDGRC
jgi:hypothetical protein